MAGLALHAFTVENELAAFYAFLAAALTIGLVMAILVFTLGIAQAKVINLIKMKTQSVKQTGGVVLIIVGIWLVVLAVWANTFAGLFSV